MKAIPLLGKIPLIGALFRSTNFNRAESELVLMVTPRIVRPVTAGTGIALPSDRVQEPSDTDLFLLGRSEVITPVRPAAPLPGPDNAVNRPRATTISDAARPGGIEGDFGHIVR